MKTKIEGVPEGWELVAIRKAIKGEFVIGENGKPALWPYINTCVFSAIIREVPKPEPRYRPFKNAKEFIARKDDWICSGPGFARVVHVEDNGIRLHVWEPMFVEFGIAFTSFKFKDGTPFGVLVSE